MFRGGWHKYCIFMGANMICINFIYPWSTTQYEQGKEV